MRITHELKAVFAAAFAVALVLLPGTEAQSRAPDWEKTVGPAECSECHKDETEAWKASSHFATFKKIPRDKEARRIAKVMGFKRIKKGSLCLTCHFSSQEKNGKPTPIAGITCESCHTGARDWLKRHSEYSGKKKETETAAEKAQRWKDAEAAGMIRPANIYQLTKNCYSCHVVPEEEMVNKANHTAGSPFELVSWSQGEVRHNTWHNAGEANREISQERRRLFYTVGVAVELESAMRALSKATKVERYAVTMAKRVEIARLRIRRLARATQDPDLVNIARLASGAQLSLETVGSLAGIADQIGESAKAFASKHDGSQLAAVDAYIPDASKAKGNPRSPKGS